MMSNDSTRLDRNDFRSTNLSLLSPLSSKFILHSKRTYDFEYIILSISYSYSCVAHRKNGFTRAAAAAAAAAAMMTHLQPFHSLSAFAFVREGSRGP